MPSWLGVQPQFLVLILIVFVLIPLALAIIAARDMSGRGQPGWLYGLLVLIAFPLGLATWLIVRARLSSQHN
jgi:hypothetical protein